MGKLSLVAVAVALSVSVSTLHEGSPAGAQPTPTASAIVPTPSTMATPTATVVSPTASPTATAVVPTASPSPTPFAPVINFNPPQLSFTATVGGNNPPEQALYIWNSGSGAMDWEVTETIAWLGLFPATGTSTGEPDTVAAWVDITGLDPGWHTGNILILSTTAGNSPQVVLVSLKVSEEGAHATPTATVAPTASPVILPTSTPTPTATPAPPPEDEEEGLPPWVWAVIGVLALLVLAFGLLLLNPVKLWGRLRGLFSRGGEEAEGLTAEEKYEDTYGDGSGEPPEDYD